MFAGAHRTQTPHPHHFAPSVHQVEQQTEEHIFEEQFLDNIFPGLTLSSLSDTYADDIFAGVEVWMFGAHAEPLSSLL